MTDPLGTPRPVPDYHTDADRLQHLRGLAATLSEVYGYLADQAHDEEMAGYGDDDDLTPEELEAEGRAPDDVSPYPGVRDRVFNALAARTPGFTGESHSPEAIHDDWAADDPAAMLASPEAAALLAAGREAYDLIHPLALEQAQADEAEGLTEDEDRLPFVGWDGALERDLDAIGGDEAWEGRPQWVTEAMEVRTTDLTEPTADTPAARAHIAMAKRLAEWDNEFEIGVLYLEQQGMTEADAMRTLGLGQERETPAPQEQPVWEPRVVVTLTKEQARVLAAILHNVSDEYSDVGPVAPALAYVDEADQPTLGDTLNAILDTLQQAQW